MSPCSGCLKINVTLANGPLENQRLRSIQGSFELFDLINGKLSWKSITHVIWYSPEFNDWNIGLLSNIGTDYDSDVESLSDVHSTSFGTVVYDCPVQVPKDMWHYYEQDEWKIANLGDIVLQGDDLTCDANIRNHKDEILSQRLDKIESKMASCSACLTTRKYQISAHVRLLILDFFFQFFLFFY